MNYEDARDRARTGNYAENRDEYHRAAADPTQGVKHDTGKLPLELLPFDALEEVTEILKFGAAKYARRNWEKGLTFERVAGAILRHTFAWLRGEDRDPETGRSHMAHAACECLFLVAFERRGRKDLDDRGKAGPTGPVGSPVPGPYSGTGFTWNADSGTGFTWNADRLGWDPPREPRNG